MADKRDTSFFDTVKQKVDLEDYLAQHLNVEFVNASSGTMHAICPFHEEDTPSFVLYQEGEKPWKTWHCFGACQEGGSVLDAVMKSEGLDVFEAAELLNELYDLGLEQDSAGYESFKKTREETRVATERAREEMESPESRAGRQARDYLHNRGYEDETISHFELGVDTGHTEAGRLAIPIYDRMGQPVSVANRALFDEYPCSSCREPVKAKEMRKRRFQFVKAKDKGEELPFPEWEACPHCGAPKKESRVSWLVGQEPKYLFLKDFDKARYLYHEHGARGPLLKDPEDLCLGLLLAEGYPDVWAGWQSGQKAICAYSGSVLSDEQAKAAVELAKKSGKPIILVPDFDETGQGHLNAGSGVGANIRKLHSVDPTTEVQVVHGIDELLYTKDGQEKGCKDLGEVNQHHGSEAVAKVLKESRWPAGEWLIRQIVEAINPKTGEAFHSKTKEMELVGEVLRGIQTRESLDHLIPILSEHWRIREEQARNFFYAHLSSEDQASARHLLKTIEQAQEESAEFLADSNVIPLGFAEIDACFMGGGVRHGQMMMALGKSMALDAKILTPEGWSTMGEMGVGTVVVDPATGGQAKVARVHPQGQRQMYRIAFDDGSVTEADGEHLWRVRADEGGEWLLSTTQEVASMLEDGVGCSIPLTKPVAFRGRGELPVPAHDLGTALAGGSEGAASLGRAVGALWPSFGELSIPDAYLWAAPEDRWALFHGILHTSGKSIVDDAGKGKVEILLVGERLARDVLHLVQSLGGTGHLEEGPDCSLCLLSIPFLLDAKLDDREFIPRKFASIEPSRVTEAQCIGLDSEAQIYLTNDFIVTHNSGTGKTMLASQFLANMADRDINCLFFSLEQGAGSFFPRLACQALDRSPEEVEQMIKTNDPELARVRELYRNMLILDNVPTETSEAVTMTPGRIQSIINESNLTHFEGKPVDVVIIDHLGILEVGSDAPGDVRKSDTAAPGWIMKELFKVCKATRTFMIVLQQLPKEVKAGVPFAMDAGWGGSQQTNFCDYILQIWRPEQEEGIDEQRILEVEGQYKVAMGKNRYGRGVLCHYYFDKTTLRILPPLKVAQPAVEMRDDGEMIFVGDEGEAPPVTSSEAGATASSMRALVDSTPDAVPKDTQALLDALGAAEEEAAEADSHEDDPFATLGASPQDEAEGAEAPPASDEPEPSGEDGLAEDEPAGADGDEPAPEPGEPEEVPVADPPAEDVSEAEVPGDEAEIPDEPEAAEPDDGDDEGESALVIE
jgi:DNA primase